MPFEFSSHRFVTLEHAASRAGGSGGDGGMGGGGLGGVHISSAHRRLPVPGQGSPHTVLPEKKLQDARPTQDADTFTIWLLVQLGDATYGIELHTPVVTP